MSTRSATIIQQEQTSWNVTPEGRLEASGKEIVEVARFYRHCDGYPDGHGLHMAYSFNTTADTWYEDWFQKAFGPFMTGQNLIGTPFESWGAPTLEFEPKGTMHGDLEYLYAVTHKGTGLEITVWEIGWDENYEDVMKREPLFSGTPKEYIENFEFAH